MRAVIERREGPPVAGGSGGDMTERARGLSREQRGGGRSEKTSKALGVVAERRPERREVEVERAARVAGFRHVEQRQRLRSGQGGEAQQRVAHRSLGQPGGDPFGELRRGERPGIAVVAERKCTIVAPFQSEEGKARFGPVAVGELEIAFQHPVRAFRLEPEMQARGARLQRLEPCHALGRCAELIEHSAQHP